MVVLWNLYIVEIQHSWVTCGILIGMWGVEIRTYQINRGMRAYPALNADELFNHATGRFQLCLEILI